jgi:hypothetical protein
MSRRRAQQAQIHRADPGTSLTWRRDGAGWVLLAGCRRFGRVVSDSKYAGMWRSTLSGGRNASLTEGVS